MKDKKYRKLLIEMGIAICVLFLFTILLNGYAIYQTASGRTIARFQKKAIDVITMESSELAPGKDNDSGFVTRDCLDFWVEYPEEVKQKIRDLKTYKNLIDAMRGLIASRKDVFESSAYDDFNFDLLTHDEQVLYAAYEYALESLSYNSWFDEDEEKISLSIKSFLLNEDGSTFMLLASDPDFKYDSSADDFELSFKMALGDTEPFELNSHPSAVKAIETKQIQTDPERVFSKNERKARINFFAPILKDNKAVGLVRVTFDWTDTLWEIWRSVAEVEWINLIALLLTALILLFIVYFAAIRPLLDIQENVRDYREFKDSEKIIKNVANMRYFNEFGMMADDIASLADEMERYTAEVRELTGEKEKKKTELDIAHQIQTQNIPKVFPAFPERKEFDIYASMDTAQEVGGDFYDFFFIDDDHLMLVIADVSGKGVPASLFMMTTRAYIKNTVTAGKLLSPGEILTLVNGELCSGNDTLMFVTVWVGVLNVSTGILKTADAGHEKPAICTGGGYFEYREDDSGFVVGLFDGASYNETEYKLEKGDTVFVYTDGVTEAENIRNEFFGKDRLLRALNSHKDEDVKDIISNVRECVAEFTGIREHSDDITMMAVRLL